MKSALGSVNGLRCAIVVITVTTGNCAELFFDCKNGIEDIGSKCFPRPSRIMRTASSWLNAGW